MAHGNVRQLEAKSYTVTDLGTFETTFWSTYANGINDIGQVVGSSRKYLSPVDHADHAFLWEDGDMIDLTPDEISSYASIANSINNKGQVVGVYPSTSGPIPDGHTRGYHAFFWDETTGIEDLGTLGGVASYGLDINNHGQVVGTILSAQTTSHAFRWDNISGMQVLEGLGNASTAEAINNVGQVVGWYTDAGNLYFPYIWDETTGMRPIAAVQGRGFDINDSGQVVGMTTDNPIRAFTWNMIDGMQYLETPDLTQSIAFAINEVGQIVGSFGNEAVIWEHGLMLVLDELIPPNSGWKLESAHDINEVGQIVGSGQKDGKLHGFLLTPILDNDNDGIPDDEDNCPSTVMPEAVPMVRLGVNRFALTNPDGMFVTVAPKVCFRQASLTFQT
jgi:probable HAF family extracellular repeat protein